MSVSALQPFTFVSQLWAAVAASALRNPACPSSSFDVEKHKLFGVYGGVISHLQRARMCRFVGQCQCSLVLLGSLDLLDVLLAEHSEQPVLDSKLLGAMP